MTDQPKRIQRPLENCGTCRHYAPLSPGQAAICFERWKDLPWNAAVPLTSAGDWCESHADVLLDLANR